MFRSLESEWQQLAGSRFYRRRLEWWASEEPALAGLRGQDVVDIGRSRDQDRACAVLEALARLAQAGDEMALRTALQALLPRLVTLAGTYLRPGLDIEERAAMIVAIAGEEVARCVPGTARTPYDFRLWSNVRRRFGRQVAAHARAMNHLVLTELAELDRSAGPRVEREVGGHDLVALCAWVAQQAGLEPATARLIVLTRVAGVPLEHLATAEGRTAATLRKRRNRAEAKLRAALARRSLDHVDQWCA